MDLTGKVGLVTGANSGLGLAYARGLARGGADVVIWGRRADKNEAAAAALRAFGGKVISQVVDVSVEAEVAAGIAAAVEDMGRLDCVIANAGSTTAAPFHEMTSAMYHELLATSQHGAFYTLREAAAHMVRRGKAGDPGGSLIICGSMAIFTGTATIAHYAAAKGALNSMAKTMAVELGPRGIRVNVIAPGLVVTEMIENAGDIMLPLLEQTRTSTPLRRVGRMQDYEGIAVYLASDASQFHSGDTIVIDGGSYASKW